MRAESSRIFHSLRRAIAKASARDSGSSSLRSAPTSQSCGSGTCPVLGHGYHWRLHNNLRSFTLKVLKHCITVVTGVSGSGHSSLVFDMIATESQRQLNESYSHKPVEHLDTVLTHQPVAPRCNWAATSRKCLTMAFRSGLARHYYSKSN